LYVLIWSINGIPDPHSFAFLYIGNAFFIFVGSTLLGTFQVIQSDREWYQTIRYVYISPISYYVYILGRAFSKIVVSVFAVLITLPFGVFLLGSYGGQMQLPLYRLPLFFVSLALGLFVLLPIGITLGSETLLMARHSQALEEYDPV